jgi:membrane-bound lytic murein transglycosylase B
MNVRLRSLFNLLLCGSFLIIGVADGVPAAAQAQSVSYLARPEVREFIGRLVEEHGLDKARLEGLFAKADQQESALEAIARPAEAKPWHEYREIFVTGRRIQGGVEFWNENEQLLARAEAFFGVPAEIIVAIIGVETYYGRQTGDYPVFDTLVTLGFDYPPRSEFFASELEHFLLLSREESLDMAAAEGSYAGAMGMGQFIPSSYRQYAVDFDGDGKRDLWNSKADAIGSVANYFRVHGWISGAPVAFPAEVSGTDYRELVEKGMEPTIEADLLSARGIKPQGQVEGDARVALLEYDAGDAMQYWVGLNNFYVITRYNRSSLYAMAVYQLSEAIKQARDTRLANTGL